MTKSEKRALMMSVGGLILSSVFYYTTTNQDDADILDINENLCGKDQYFAEIEFKTEDRIHNWGDICFDGERIINKFGKFTERPADKTFEDKLDALDKEICEDMARILEIRENSNLIDEQRSTQLNEVFDGEMSEKEINEILNMSGADLRAVRDDVVKCSQNLRFSL